MQFHQTFIFSYKMVLVADIYKIEIQEEDTDFMKDVKEYLMERNEYLKMYPKTVNSSNSCYGCPCGNDSYVQTLPTTICSNGVLAQAVSCSSFFVTQCS